MGGRFAAFALIAVLVLAGCTGTPGHPDDPGPTAPAISSPATTPTTPAALSDPPDTSSAPTSPAPAVGTQVPADVPTTGPNLRHKGEHPPVMPLLATKHTPAGAVAFAKFFIQTIDWGFATTSGAYMRHYYAASCIECDSHADGLDNTRKAGGHYLGGRFQITGAESEAVGPHNGQRSVLVTFDVTAIEALNRHNDFMNGEIGHRDEQRQLWLVWHDARWDVVDMAPPQ